MKQQENLLLKNSNLVQQSPITFYENKLTHIDQDVKIYKTKLESVQQELQNQIKNNQSLNQQLKQEQQEKTNLIQQVQFLQEKTDFLQIEQQQFQINNQQAMSQLCSVEKQNHDIISEKQKLESKVNILTLKLQQSEDELKSQQLKIQQNLKYDKLIESSQEIIKKQSIQITNLQKQIDDHLQSQQKQVNCLFQSQQLNFSDKYNIDVPTNDLLLENSKMYQQISDLKNEIIQLESKIKISDQQNMQEKIMNLITQLNDDDLINQVDIIQKSYAEKRREIEKELNEKTKSQEIALQQYEEISRKLLNQEKAYALEQEENLQMLKQMNSQLQYLEDQVHDYNQLKLQKLNDDDLIKNQNEKINSLEFLNENLQRANNNYVQQVEKWNSEFTNNEKQFEQQCQMLQKQNQDLQEKLFHIQSEFTQQQKIYDKKLIICDEMEKELLHAKELIAQRKVQQELQDNYLKTVKQDIDHFINTKAQMEKHRVVIETNLDAANNQIQKLIHQETQFKQQIKVMAREITQKQQEIDQIKHFYNQKKQKHSKDEQFQQSDQIIKKEYFPYYKPHNFHSQSVEKSKDTLINLHDISKSTIEPNYEPKLDLFSTNRQLTPTKLPAPIKGVLNVQQYLQQYKSFQS